MEACTSGYDLFPCLLIDFSLIAFLSIIYCRLKKIKSNFKVVQKVLQRRSKIEVASTPLPDPQLLLARGGMSRTRTEAIRVHGLQQPPVAMLIDEVLKAYPTSTVEKAEIVSHVRTWGSSAKSKYPDIPFTGDWSGFEEFIVKQVTIFPWGFHFSCFVISACCISHFLF